MAHKIKRTNLIYKLFKNKINKFTSFSFYYRAFITHIIIYNIKVNQDNGTRITDDKSFKIKSTYKKGSSK